MLTHSTNLTATLDDLAGAFFFHQTISPVLRDESAALIISRQQKSGANAGSFIPFTTEIVPGAALFTGEKLRTAFARNHAQMIEAARILKLLAVENHGVAQAVQSAYHRMLDSCYASFCAKGECKTLTMAFLHFLALEGGEGSISIIEEFLSRLTSYRDGKGKWKGFPFYFTLWVLTEIPHPLSSPELQYSAPTCEKLRSLNQNPDLASKRRLEILTRVLERN